MTMPVFWLRMWDTIKKTLQVPNATSFQNTYAFSILEKFRKRKKYKVGIRNDNKDNKYTLMLEEPAQLYPISLCHSII